MDEAPDRLDLPKRNILSGSGLSESQNSGQVTFEPHIICIRTYLHVVLKALGQIQKSLKVSSTDKARIVLTRSSSRVTRHVYPVFLVVKKHSSAHHLITRIPRYKAMFLRKPISEHQIMSIAMVDMSCLTLHSSTPQEIQWQAHRCHYIYGIQFISRIEKCIVSFQMRFRMSMILYLHYADSLHGQIQVYVMT